MQTSPLQEDRTPLLRRCKRGTPCRPHVPAFLDEPRPTTLRVAVQLRLASRHFMQDETTIDGRPDHATRHALIREPRCAVLIRIYRIFIYSVCFYRLRYINGSHFITDRLA